MPLIRWQQLHVLICIYYCQQWKQFSHCMRKQSQHQENWSGWLKLHRTAGGRSKPLDSSNNSFEAWTHPLWASSSDSALVQKSCVLSPSLLSSVQSRRVQADVQWHTHVPHIRLAFFIHVIQWASMWTVQYFRFRLPQNGHCLGWKKTQCPCNVPSMRWLHVSSGGHDELQFSSKDAYRPADHAWIKVEKLFWFDSI